MAQHYTHLQNGCVLASAPVQTASQWPLPPIQGHRDPCSTKTLQVPDLKADRVGPSLRHFRKAHWWICVMADPLPCCDCPFAHDKSLFVLLLFALASLQPPWSPPFCSSSSPALSHRDPLYPYLSGACLLSSMLIKRPGNNMLLPQQLLPSHRPPC